MPETAKLMARGSFGTLETLEPTESPPIWTSIATGKRPEKHGITGFTNPERKGGDDELFNSLDRKTKAIQYEEYLKRIAEVVERVGKGYADEIPEELKRSAGLRAVYNNLMGQKAANSIGQFSDDTADYRVSDDPINLKLALKIDETVKQVRPDGWRGLQARENVIKKALLPLLNNDVAEVERVFAIIKQQPEY